MDDIKEIENCLRFFVEGSLVEKNVDSVMGLFTDDLMGIGMGTQGIVSCKEDARRLFYGGNGEGRDARTTVSYSDVQVRCYEKSYASICAELEIVVEAEGGGAADQPYRTMCQSAQGRRQVENLYAAGDAAVGKCIRA